VSKKNEKVIPSDISPYLYEIAERLWSGHAAVMVGAGFSKNAKKSNPSKKGFPDWHQLGNIFYEKIYGWQPDAKQHYLNVLKLADEVQAAFGRPVLDQILRSQIPDKDHEPSQLHIKLMELPWSDVFTTNYDTLLERACVNVTSQKFDIVINKEDLVYSEKPRIIKLHGSFPSERPFIITGEDYRKYPKEFAPFVNTVQQSLLENTLCLIGFSGDDPNFLHWIGWIHDNLGKGNSPKIYLIGLLHLSDAQKKLLEQRNIVAVDLAAWQGVDDDHEKAITVFLEFLLSEKKSENNLGWPVKQQLMSPRHNEDIVQQLLAVSKKWEATRKNYPNWVILPEDRRNSLWAFTEHWIPSVKNSQKLDEPIDIEFLFELNWRMEKCLCPISNDLIDVYEKILERYNPFPKVLITDKAIKPTGIKHKDLPWKEIELKWFELHISIMRFYREEGFLDKWNAINETIQNLYQFLSPELVAKLYYERCLYSLFSLKVSDVKSLIKEWPANKSLPLWEAKRAGLLAELGDIEEAEKIVEYSLSFIRTQLNLTPVSSDYSWVSQEAYVMLLLQYIKHAISFRDGQFEKREEIRQRFNERWNDLKQYKCDPWNELKLFEIYLEREPVSSFPSVQKNEFDIGRVTKTYHWGGANKEALTAYSFLRYCEDAGIPFRIPGGTFGKKAAEGALKRISNYSPYWAFAALVRIGDSNVVDTIFNRKSIVKMDISQIDRLIDHYLSVIESVFSEIEDSDRFRKENFAIVLASVIPEIISRLCVKCSDKTRQKLLDFLKNLYSSDQKHKFRNVANLTERLITSCSNETQYRLLPKLLEFPILSNLVPLTEREFPEPFHFLDINNESSAAEHGGIQIEEGVINDLLLKAGSLNTEERKRSVLRLVKLYELNLLDAEQVKNYSTVLWDQIDESSGFPKETDFYKFAFLKLPHPEKIDPVSLFKIFVLKEPFPIQGSKTGQGIPITRGNIQISREILDSTETGINWSQEETIQILNRLTEWWDADKHFLKKDRTPDLFGSIPDEFRARFRHLVSILAHVVAPRLSINTDTNTKATVSRLLRELDEYGIPSLQAHAAFLNIFPDVKSQFYLKIQDYISSADHSKIVDALEAALVILYSRYTSSDSKNEINDTLNSVSQQIKWRREIGLTSSLNVISNIVKKTPQYLNESLLSDVLIGLKYLHDESDPGYTQVDTDIADRLTYRKLAARLAYMLFKHFSGNGENIPKVIVDWKAICSSTNEFAEIRNEWMEA